MLPLQQASSFQCPKRGKLAALVTEEERQEEEGRIASMSLLSAIQTKVGEQLGGRMYVETEVKREETPSYGGHGSGHCIHG